MRLSLRNFSLRNLMWLTLLLAIGMAWGVEHFRADARLQEVRREPARWHGAEVEVRPRSAGKDTWLAKLSDTALLERIRNEHEIEDLEPYLLEASRRGLKQEIADSYKQIMQGLSLPRVMYGGCGNVPRRERRNADYLTALRRAFDRPDPIKVSIRSIGEDSKGNPLLFPLIIPCIENVDVERETCILASPSPLEGYWRNRHVNWRVLLINDRGELMKEIEPALEHLPFDSTIMLYGEKIGGYELDARSYVKPPPSGRYTLQLIYDHDQSLVNADLSQRIVWKSEPVKVVVMNRTLTSQWEAVVTPNVILCSTMTAILGLGILTYRRRVSPRICDWLALAMLALFATSWSLDLFRIKDEIAERTEPANSAWSMRLEK